MNCKYILSKRVSFALLCTFKNCKETINTKPFKLSYVMFYLPMTFFQPSNFGVNSDISCYLSNLRTRISVF